MAIILGRSKSHLYRVPYAVTKYKNGRIDKIIVSGGNVLPSEKGRKLVVGELKNIIAYVKRGIIDDFDTF